MVVYLRQIIIIMGSIIKSNVQPQKPNNLNQDPSPQQPTRTSTSTNTNANTNASSQKLTYQKTKNNEIDQSKIGVPHIDNEYWFMVRTGKTKSLTQAFQDQLVTCNQVIVPTSGHTIVHQSIILDKREYFRLCQVYGADWDKRDVNGVTPLMKAVALNRTFYVQKLVELGVDKSIKDNRGMTAKDYGQLYQSYEALDLLNQQS